MNNHRPVSVRNGHGSDRRRRRNRQNKNMSSFVGQLLDGPRELNK